MNPEQPKEDKQKQDHIADVGQMVSDGRDWKERFVDWREKFKEWWLCNGSEYLSQDQQDAVLLHFYRYYIQPLQSQNNELKDNLKAAIQISIESKRRIFDLFLSTRSWHKAKIEALQKEVIIQKQKQAACVTEMKKLKVEIKAWEDQDGIATETAREEIERLVGVIADLNKEVDDYKAILLVGGENLIKENTELKKRNLILLKEVERLFARHGEEQTWQIIKANV